MGAAERWIFEAVPGVFQDHVALAETCPDGKITTQPGLALVSREYPTDGPNSTNEKDWTRFAEYVRSLNKDASPNVSYKVLYLTRHGYGYHNQKHAEVGEEWDNYWSFLNGDENTTWFDSYLNETGIQQVTDLGKFWLHAVDADGVPIPQTLYTSPLARCLQTTEYVFYELMKAHGKPFKPIVKEKIRERFTVHTCDLRRPRSWVAESYPGYIIEDSMTEEDPFEGQTRWETDDEHHARKQAALEEIFSSDDNEFISLTVHSWAIAAIMAVCKVPEFKTREGTSIALLVKGEKPGSANEATNGVVADGPKYS